MYKLLIVEDEPLARYVIRSFIETHFPNIQIVSEAESGREAIEVSRKFEPDIILMDVKIPGINGLEASKEILSEFPKTVILILTAYDDFNYVHQALDTGVKGYLLKPIKNDDAIEKIRKAIEFIDNSKKEINLGKKIENSINMVRPFIQKEVISAFISGKIDVSEVKSYISFIEEEIEAGYFMLISCENRTFNNINEAVRNKIHLDKAYEVILRFLPFMKKCLFGPTIGDIIVVFFPVNKDLDEKTVIAESIVIAQEIKRKINIIAGTEVFIGIGNIYKDIQSLKFSYNESYISVRKASRQCEIVQYKSIADKNSNEGIFEYPLKLENEILENIRLGSTDGAREIAKTVISQIFRNCGDSMLIKDYIGQLITMIKRTLYQKGMEQKILNAAGVLLEINNVSALDQLEIWCRNTIETLIQGADRLKQLKDKTVTNKIHSYINSHFLKEITLETAAEEVGLSAQYISKLFKEEFGIKFVDYIIEKRIGFAAELLTSGNKSIKEVSEAVGYADVNYFCRIFKKVTGLTAKQYRKQKSKKSGGL